MRSSYRLIQKGPSGRVNKVKGQYRSLDEALSALSPEWELEVQGPVEDQLEAQIRQLEMRANRLQHKLFAVTDELSRSKEAKRALVGWELRDLADDEWYAPDRGVALLLSTGPKTENEICAILGSVSDSVLLSPEHLHDFLERAQKNNDLSLREDGRLEIVPGSSCEKHAQRLGGLTKSERETIRELTR